MSEQIRLQEHMLLTLSVSYIHSKQNDRVRNRGVKVAYVQRPVMANKSVNGHNVKGMSLAEEKSSRL